MKDKISILHLEDQVADSVLIKSLIWKEFPSFDYYFVDNEQNFLLALQEKKIDIILSDYQLPDYSGAEALLVAKNQYPHIPFIFVTGKMGEDTAIESLTNGATDYVMKSKLERLVPAIRRVLYETELFQKRVASDKALTENVALYRTLVERLPDGLYKSTHDGKFVEVNPAMVTMLGYDNKEQLMAIDIKTQLYFDPSDRESMVLQEKLEELGVYRLKKKDGSGIWVEDHGWYVLDENGEILFHEGILRDITERKKAEEVLTESERSYREIFNSSNDALFIQDIVTKSIVDVNNTMLKMYGYDDKLEVLKCSIDDLSAFEEGYNENKIKILNQKMMASNSNTFEWRAKKKDGEVFWVQVSVKKTHIGGKERILASVHDITERKRAAEKLSENEALLNAIVESAMDSIFIKDTSLRYVKVNNAMSSLFGMTKEEIIGKSDAFLFGSEDIHHSEEVDKQVLSGLTVEEYPSKLVKGEKRHFHTIKVPLKDAQGEIYGLCGIARDITDKKQAQDLI